MAKWRYHASAKGNRHTYPRFHEAFHNGYLPDDALGLAVCDHVLAKFAE